MEKHTQQAKYGGKNKGRNGHSIKFLVTLQSYKKVLNHASVFRTAAQLYATRPALNWNGLCIYMHITYNFATPNLQSVNKSNSSNR